MIETDKQAIVEAEIAELQEMTTGQLANLYEQLHGQPTRARHRQYLIRKNAWRIQANAFGGLSERAKRRAAELANDADIRVMAPKTLVCPPQDGESSSRTLRIASRDPRIPAPGSAIVRTYKDRARSTKRLDARAPEHGVHKRRGALHYAERIAVESGVPAAEDPGARASGGFTQACARARLKAHARERAAS